MICVKCGLDIFFTYTHIHIRNVTFHIKITEIGVFFHMWHKTWHINMSLPHVLMRFALFGRECDIKTLKWHFPHQEFTSSYMNLRRRFEFPRVQTDGSMKLNVLFLFHSVKFYDFICVFFSSLFLCSQFLPLVFPSLLLSLSSYSSSRLFHGLTQQFGLVLCSSPPRCCYCCWHRCYPLGHCVYARCINRAVHVRSPYSSVMSRFYFHHVICSLFSLSSHVAVSRHRFAVFFFSWYFMILIYSLSPTCLRFISVESERCCGSAGSRAL